MDYISVQFEKEMDSAFHFVSSCLEESGHNTKPVLFHSFKAAMFLYSSGYSQPLFYMICLKIRMLRMMSWLCSMVPLLRIL